MERPISDVSQRLELEEFDLSTRSKQVRSEFQKLARRKLILQEEWKKVRVDQARLEEDRRRFQAARKSQWFQSTMLPTSEARRVRLNVGGQVFETSVRVLRRDPDSLLAALASDSAPLELDEAGCFYIDRDWWLFRHIMRFVRDGRLPQERELLTQLYHEAEFYNLETLRTAVREFLDPSHLVERTAAMPIKKLQELEVDLRKQTKERSQRERERSLGLPPDDGADAALLATGLAKSDAYESLRSSLRSLPQYPERFARDAYHHRAQLGAADPFFDQPAPLGASGPARQRLRRAYSRAGVLGALEEEPLYAYLYPRDQYYNTHGPGELSRRADMGGPVRWAQPRAARGAGQCAVPRAPEKMDCDGMRATCRSPAPTMPVSAGGDWWTGSMYRGNDYRRPLRNEYDRYYEGEERWPSRARPQQMISSTWNANGAYAY